MSIPPAGQQVLDFFGTPLVFEPSHDTLRHEPVFKLVADRGHENPGVRKAPPCPHAS
jgi:hypothetical protein